jgi:hypothetical protein
MDWNFQRLVEDRFCLGDEYESLKTCPLNPDGANLKGTFFVGLKNGFHAPYFVSGRVDENIWIYRSRKTLYLRAPPGACCYSLRGTTRTTSGWNYKIAWLSDNLSVIWQGGTDVFNQMQGMWPRNSD